MKVCQLCAVDFTLEKFLLPLIDKMELAGWEVVAVCSEGESISKLINKGYKIDTINIERSFNVLKHVVSFFKLVRYFRKENYDIIHVHTPVASLIARFAAIFSNTKIVVYTAHGFYFHDEMSVWIKNIFIVLERIAGRFTQLLFTVSTEDAETAIKKNIISKDKVFAVGNGVNSEKFKPKSLEHSNKIKRVLGIPADAFVIGMVGRLVEEKGVVEFLNAAKSISEQFTNVVFILVGERLSSDHATAVDEVITSSKIKLGNSLILTGLREDIPDILSAMDVFCLPSWREGMPITILEAMMMGKAVVATNIRGCREEVMNGKTGLLVNLKDSSDLSNAFQSLIESPDLVVQFGMAGRERALKLYDEQLIMNNQMDILCRVAREKGLLI